MNWERRLKGHVDLGTLRSYPPRHLAFSQHHDPDFGVVSLCRFAGGGYAWAARSSSDNPPQRSEVRSLASINGWATLNG